MIVLRKFGRFEVRFGRGGTVYCTCPAWRRQRRPPGRRLACRHIRRFYMLRQRNKEVVDGQTTNA